VIALIDYGAGNLRSVHKALRSLEADVRVFTRPEGLEGARALVLPGVGAFDDCLHALERQDLVGACRDFIGSGRPFLGICVGYQALFERSDEFNSHAAGLGIFRGSVVRLPSQPNLKVPQMGWNRVEFVRPDCPLFDGLPADPHFYFVHSFYPQPVMDPIVAGRTDYGTRFASVVWKDNVYATQFHPEKSQRNGLRLLRNFLCLAG
jgi:imidazole glycerol-phosphate synthase subunit HisH